MRKRFGYSLPVFLDDSLWPSGWQSSCSHQGSASTFAQHPGVGYLVSIPSCTVSSTGICNHVGNYGDGHLATLSCPVACTSIQVDLLGPPVFDATPGANSLVGLTPNVVPVQVQTVDGSVSMFQSLNMAPMFCHGNRQSTTNQAENLGVNTGNTSTTNQPENLSVNTGNTTYAPMVLDFSVGRTLHAADSGADADGDTINLHSNRAPLRSGVRNSVASRPRIPNGQSPTGNPNGPPMREPVHQALRNSAASRPRIPNGQSSTGNPNGPPMREPVHPAQQQGAPLEYAYFGRCDQLFRTARDKLLDADIPNFHIRLFGVVGANQYELPVGDSIGAIVYEGGPESMTDYDVVIERHSREPESVNKLHPRYMSLQFPLLFIYGEEGYHLRLTLKNLLPDDQREEKKMSMKVFYAYQLKMSLTVETEPPSKTATSAVVLQRAFAYLNELNPTDNSKFIQVRVYRKWTAMKVPSRIPTAFSCMLLDKKGFAIQANADLKEKDRFDKDLQINCVYKIQGFGFDKTDNWGKTLDNDFTLCFGKYTQIDLLQDSDYPYHYFNFAAFNELSARLEKNNPILTGTIANRIMYNQANTVAPRLEVQTERLTDWEQERNRNRVPLGTLLQIDPNTQQRVLFTQDAMILRIDTAHEWYYQKCDECGGKLNYGYVHGQCHQYGSKPNPQNSYCFRIIITDGTGNATMTCFTPQTDGLIKDVNTLLQEVRDKNPTNIPAAILALQNTRHLFQFRFAKPIPKGPTTFVLHKIMDSPPAALPEATSGPSSPPIPTAEQHAGEHFTPPPVTPTATQETPVDSQAEVPAVGHISSSSSTRKELFSASTQEETQQETDPAPKKQKKE
ncbi:hypothetical protein CTI12_AA022180 [Artemisia annua]|uniref:Replication protein A 70 kDa DNA-binding subunit B/D first OB fold domain-containing protein n=1 Tax=Artemisia annua TaxID=35608 RepID=A0A2U1QBY3_ARTAN|nr:hypothetical protein CTI12_AA022180 [Artemisia annua]